MGPGGDGTLEVMNTEAALLGGLLSGDNLRNEGVAEIIALLDPRDFSTEGARLVAKAIRACHEAGSPADIITVQDYLRRAGYHNISLAPYASSVISFDLQTLREYLAIVRRDGVRRRKRQAALALARALNDGEQGKSYYEWKMRQALEEPETLTLTAECYAVEELLATKFPLEPNLWGAGLLQRKSVMLLSAFAKSYKTMFALNLAISLAAGKDFLFAINEPVRVLYLQAEVSMRSMQERIKYMLREVVPKPGFLVIANWRGEKLTTRRGYESVLRLLHRYSPAVVVVDPLYKVHTYDENKAQEINKLLAVFDRLIERHGISLILVHHHGKRRETAGKLSPEMVRGSSAIFDYVDTSIRMAREENTTREVKVSFTCRNGEEPADTYLIMGANLWFRRIEEDEEVENA